MEIRGLDTLVHATFAGGGDMPFIHKTLTAGKVKKAEGGGGGGVKSTHIGDLVPSLVGLMPETLAPSPSRCSA